MKILHILYDEVDNPWFGGGGAIRNREIYKRMAKKHEITVLTGTYPFATKEAIRNDVKYIRLGVGNNIWQSLISFSINIFWYRNYGGFDLVVKDILPLCPVYTPFLPFKTPVIASIQNMEYHFFRAYKLLGVLPWMNHEVSIRLYKNYLLTANSMYGLLRKKTAKDAKIKVIPYGVEDELFSVVPSEENYILYLGRFDIFQKGLDILLKAFKIVSSKFPQIELIFAGGGVEEGRLKKMVEDLSLSKKVRFIGRAHGGKKRDLLAKCLFICRPSRFESFGLGALEASACAKAVIVSNVSGNLEVVKVNKTALIVEPNNIEHLALAMVELIKDREKRKQLGEAGRIWAKNFNWNNLAQEQEKFYLKIVDEAK